MSTAETAEPRQGQQSPVLRRSTRRILLLTVFTVSLWWAGPALLVLIVGFGLWLTAATMFFFIAVEALSNSDLRSSKYGPWWAALVPASLALGGYAAHRLMNLIF